MVRTGLWVELEVITAFVFGLGLASLMGERTLPIVLMIVYTIVSRPFLLGLQIPHLINFQRSMLEPAVAHLEPSGVGFVYGVAGGPGLVRLVTVAAGVDDHGGRRDRGLTRGLDGSRRLADDDQGRLRNAWLNAAEPCTNLMRRRRPHSVTLGIDHAGLDSGGVGHDLRRDGTNGHGGEGTIGVAQGLVTTAS